MEINYDKIHSYVWSRDYPEGSSDNQKRAIVEACHADKLGGHFGRDKT